MDTLENLALFVSIVEKRGLAAGGREHGLSPATVSERVAALERTYGTRLLNRTTRAVGPTDAGLTLVDGARHLVAEADSLASRVRDGVERLSGRIRLSAPVDLGQCRIAPLLDAFMDDNAGISIELELSDGHADLVAGGFDLAVRLQLPDDSGLVARKLAVNRRLVCAAPDYLRRHSMPAHPRELDTHDCLVMRFGQTLGNVWPFRVDGKRQRVTVSGSRIANDGRQVRSWCVAGRGLALKSEWDVAKEIASGALVSCLDDFATDPTGVYAVYPSGIHLPTRVRHLVDFLEARFCQPSG